MPEIAALTEDQMALYVAMNAVENEESEKESSGWRWKKPFAKRFNGAKNRHIRKF